MSCCRVPRYASSLAQAAWGWGQGSCKGTFPTQEDVGGPWGCDPASPPHPPLQAPHRHTFGRCRSLRGDAPHTCRDGGAAMGRAPPPALPPRLFRANFQRAGRRRRPVPGSGWAGDTAGARLPLPKGRSDTHPLPRVLRGRGRGRATPRSALPPG